jgi:hypothetical protein
MPEITWYAENQIASEVGHNIYGIYYNCFYLLSLSVGFPVAALYAGYMLQCW